MTSRSHQRLAALHLQAARLKVAGLAELVARAEDVGLSCRQRLRLAGEAQRITRVVEANLEEARVQLEAATPFFDTPADDKLTELEVDVLDVAAKLLEPDEVPS